MELFASPRSLRQKTAVPPKSVGQCGMPSRLIFQARDFGGDRGGERPAAEVERARHKRSCTNIGLLLSCGSDVKGCISFIMLRFSWCDDVGWTVRGRFNFGQLWAL